MTPDEAQQKARAQIVLRDVYGLTFKFSAWTAMSLDQVMRIAAVMNETVLPSPAITIETSQKVTARIPHRDVHRTGDAERTACCGMRYRNLPTGDIHTAHPEEVNCNLYKPSYVDVKPAPIPLAEEPSDD